MSAKEESALWRQRFFEAQAGMERYLVEIYGHDEIARWLPVKAEILKDLDVPFPEADELRSWKERFFKTQATLEKYVVEHHGLKDLELWAVAIAQIFKFTEPNRGGGASDMALRFARQAHCYRSAYELEQLGQDFAKVTLQHCAIWDYREQARLRGVPLTLKSPCTYCTKATAANAHAKGFTATYELHEDGNEHGCTWEIRNSR
jgi:hypothetical protein